MESAGQAALVVLGVAIANWSYEIARAEERLDAVGSKRSWSEVEPATWKVLLTQLVGAWLIVMGVFALLPV